MKPELRDKWNEALDAFKKAERHLSNGEHDAAKSEARQSAGLGAFVIMDLFPESDQEMRLVAAAPAVDAFFDWEKECSCSRDYVERARRLLRECISLSPPENKLWGEEILKPLNR